MPNYLEKPEIKRLAEELLGSGISYFAVDFIHGMSATEESVRAEYSKLVKLGLSDEKIASRAELLGLNPETIQRNYENLRRIGLSDEKIASRAELLGRDPETIQRNYENLSDLGLSDEKIAQQAALLSQNPETIQRNYKNLRRIGLSDEKIATSTALLSQNPETIQRNYDHHIGMLGGRESGKFILTSQAQLLSRPPGTEDNGSKKFRASGGFAGTFQHLAYIDRMGGKGHDPIHRRKPMLLGTTPANKREKLAFLLREVYDYRELGHDEKKSAIKKVYRLVSNNPQLLVDSISTLSGKVERLRQKSA